MFAIDIYDSNKNCSVFSITNTLAMSVTPFNLVRQREHQADFFFF